MLRITMSWTHTKREPGFLGVDVDEARGDYEALRVDVAVGSCVNQVSNARDPVAPNRDVPRDRRAAAAVCQGAPSQDEVEGGFAR